MKKILLIVLLFFTVQISRSQGTWAAVGTGTGLNSGSLGALTITADTVNNFIYAGGDFLMADATPAQYVAKWDGASWSAMPGLTNTVRSLCMFGGELYAAGNIAGYVNKWNGSSWVAVGTGLNAVVDVICVHGGQLYAGGYFTTAGGVTANHIAKFNGVNWDSVGTGLDAEVFSMTSYGGKLYVGGVFNNAGSITVNHIATWDGVIWSGIGTGVSPGSGANVNTIGFYGGQPFIGGGFTTPTYYIARYNGTNWVYPGVGTDSPPYSLLPFNGKLFAGGSFTSSPANHIAQWNGTSWASVAGGTNGFIKSMCILSGSLYVVGGFSFVGSTSVAAYSIAKYTPAVTTGVNSVSENDFMNVYPNPASDQIIISVSDKKITGGVEIKMMNTLGQIIFSKKENEENYFVDVSKFPKGIYTVTVSGKDFVETKRVVVE